MSTRQGDDPGPDRRRDPHPPDLDAWDRLGRHIRERRAELGLTQAEVASVGGPSPATLYQLESGLRGSYRPHILRRLERALGWGAGSVRRVLAGGVPLLEGETEIRRARREEHPSRSGSTEWVAGFRELPIDPRDKLQILSSLLEETIAELGAGSNGGSGPRTRPTLSTEGRPGLPVARPPFG